MISHEYGCIFIHIPRCAGTSIETWLCGEDWWITDAYTKHLIASQARRIYAEYWDEYFKFAIVRDPYSRNRSLLNYGEHYGLIRDAGGPIDFSGYEANFGPGTILEHDRRFARRDELTNERHRPGRVYGNILDEKLDFIARYERLASDMAVVQHRIGFPTPFNVHVERSVRQEPDLSAVDRSWVAATYADDFRAFGYAL